MPKLAIRPSTRSLSSIGKPSFRVDQEYPKTCFFLKNEKKTSKTQKLKNAQRYPKISDTPFNKRSLIHREAWFPPCFVGQNQQKKTFFARQFLTICEPSGSGGKKTFKRFLKSERTDGQTHGQTERQTFRLIESIGPEG